MVDISFHKISRKLKSFSFPDTDLVVGIGTGGVVPASMIAHQLGVGLEIMTISFRDQDNSPLYSDPSIIVGLPDEINAETKILLVDDVSVTGKTMALACSLIKSNSVITFVLKGKADLVLFPGVKDCVNWPWKPIINNVKNE